MERNEFEMSTEIIKCVLDEILLLDLSRGHGWAWLCEGEYEMNVMCVFVHGNWITIATIVGIYIILSEE